MARNKIPVDEVINLRNQGYSNNQIVQALQKDYNYQQIYDALNQADIKKGVDFSNDAPSPDDIPKPYDESSTYSTNMKFPQPESSYQERPAITHSTEHIQELVESVINEKWVEFTQNIGDLVIWKEKVNTDLIAIKQEILRTQSRFENIQKAMLGRVEDYGKGITELGTEMKALEKVFEKILEPLTTNIKELTKITNELKSRKKK